MITCKLAVQEVSGSSLWQVACFNNMGTALARNQAQHINIAKVELRCDSRLWTKKETLPLLVYKLGFKNIVA